MKLLVISDYSWPAGGTEQFVSEILARAQDTCECKLLTWDEEVLIPPAFEGIVYPTNGDIRPVWTAIAWADCVMIVTSFNIRVLALAAKDILGHCHKPVVTVVQTSSHSDPHHPARESQEGWLGELVSASAMTVAVSETVAKSLRELIGDGCPEIDVIENGTRFRKDGGTARQDRRRIAFIGRPVPQKGFEMFRRLAKDLSEANVEFIANTVSIPPPIESPGIDYSYGLDDSQLLEFYARADLLVVPYMWADGLPLAVLEALSCGLPILGFDLPPVGPLLRRHGQAVIPPSYEQLLSAVIAWHRGALEIPSPTVGDIPSWSEQWAQYEALLRRTISETDRFVGSD